MYKNLMETIERLPDRQQIRDERKIVLQPLIDFIQGKINSHLAVNLNFI